MLYLYGETVLRGALNIRLASFGDADWRSGLARRLPTDADWRSGLARGLPSQ
jgi:hypothetical protein